MSLVALVLGGVLASSAAETGPLSGPIGQASFEPSLPGGTQAALREANCNAVVPLRL